MILCACRRIGDRQSGARTRTSRGTGAALRDAARPALQMIGGGDSSLDPGGRNRSFLRQSTSFDRCALACAAIALAAIVGLRRVCAAAQRRRPAVDLDWLFKEAPPAALPGTDSAPAR